MTLILIASFILLLRKTIAWYKSHSSEKKADTFDNIDSSPSRIVKDTNLKVYVNHKPEPINLSFKNTENFNSTVWKSPLTNTETSKKLIS